MGLLFIAGIGSFFCLSLIVKIDVKSQQIHFIYPLRFRTYSYEFASIYGYRYKYLPARIDYKVIQFKTKDGKKFTISDFETENLRKIEKLCFDYLELRRGKSFEKLNEQQKRGELRNSKDFDIQQAKDIRFFLILGLAISIFLIGMFLTNPVQLDLNILLFLTFWTVLTISMVFKLRNIQRTIKDRTQQSANPDL
ncbi:MAG: hypothetical protein RLO12_10390 [Fulvivirga sp.]